MSRKGSFLKGFGVVLLALWGLAWLLWKLLDRLLEVSAWITVPGVIVWAIWTANTDRWWGPSSAYSKAWIVLVAIPPLIAVSAWRHNKRVYR